MRHFSRTDLSGITCSASFSDCEAYRYLLTWRWSPSPLLVAWMLNPSTATHERLDPTISGLVSRARAWGQGGVRVINLFAFRATQPADMRRVIDPIGPDNDAVTLGVLTRAARNGEPVICAWGNHGQHLARDRAAVALASRAGADLRALAVNGNGSPKHPLYIPHCVTPQPWMPEARLA
ncbi:DUF1643 domain-containing protein [Sphingomonas sp.]|uniref:DUF1643 domain-containing protein n=1 Tax=Sphingomonas sp. TaxID=28214 RepID=UPI003B0078B6